MILELGTLPQEVHRARAVHALRLLAALFSLSRLRGSDDVLCWLLPPLMRPLLKLLAWKASSRP
jgi:hypothetical protein